MSDASGFDFSKFVPGFDFLQNLAKGGSPKVPQMPGLGSWVAPTVSVEELEKRIDELKAVQFWLDQNAAALKATIQALEVQKMTLATLKGMNFNMADLANAFKLKPTGSGTDSATKAAEKSVEKPVAKPAEVSPPTGSASASSTADAALEGKPAQSPAPGVVDPLQWWNSLTTQFQQIAATAMKDAAGAKAPLGAPGLAANFAKEAFKSAGEFAKAATKLPAKAPATTPAKKATGRAVAGKKVAPAKKRTR